MLVSKLWSTGRGAVPEQVVVIGAGIAGLTCAIELARSGHAVTVAEQAPRSGGKLQRVAFGSRCVDAGPTVFTMRWVFDEIFAAAGASLDDHLTLVPTDRLASHAWNDSERLDLFADIDRSADAIGVFAGAVEAHGYRRFCAASAGVYDSLRHTFLDAQRPGLFGLASRIGLHRRRTLAGLRPFDTLWGALGDYFQDVRLRQLFARYATYCGSSPFAAPATLMLVAHVEREGVWLVQGGMQRLADALEGLAVSLGVTFHYSAPATRIEVSQGRVGAVILAGGERLAAAAVVVTADPRAVAAGLFGPDVRAAVSAPAAARSLSAITWSMLGATGGAPLTRHNVFFSDDYRAEFTDILERGRLPRAPTVYVCAQDRGPAVAAPSGDERLLIVVNAPASGDVRTFDEEEVSACQTHMLDRLARCGLQVDRTPAGSRIMTPADFSRMFPATGGALYGSATHGWASTFQRPGARTRLPGLYLAGGGVHPGAGVPMAALSGRLAARRLLRDRASTRPFRRAATSGGTSTP